MTDIEPIKKNLKDGPLFLENMLKEIPEGLLKERRIKGKWSIHEHACHLVDVQQMINARFIKFRDEEKPEVKPYLPGTNVADDFLMELPLKETVAKFTEFREELLEIVADFDEQVWQKKVIHPEYEPFNPYIFLRHVMMHDHFHMYRIEESWLTNQAFLRIV
ncbi:MAG: DinB family protein [Flammeovirgaceae bacterium]|nr:DinB family protein [Flammeovirgaceae bacterium]